jgi:putative transcriptional regulator
VHPREVRIGALTRAPVSSTTRLATLIAQAVVELTDEQLAALIRNGHFSEVDDDDEAYRSDALASIHETKVALHEVGAIGNQTMREFDSCLTPVELLSPWAIRALRERERRSQPVFARYLNVSKNLVSDLERGVKRPGGPALRLLTAIEKKGMQAIA